MTAIYVLETRPHWTPELRCGFEDGGVRIRMIQSVAEAKAELANHGSATNSDVLVVDLNVGANRCLSLIASVAEQKLARIVAIGGKGSEPLEPSLRELGADSFHRYPAVGDRVIDDCRRLLRSSV